MSRAVGLAAGIDIGPPPRRGTIGVGSKGSLVVRTNSARSTPPPAAGEKVRRMAADDSGGTIRASSRRVNAGLPAIDPTTRRSKSG